MLHTLGVAYMGVALEHNGVACDGAYGDGDHGDDGDVDDVCGALAAYLI